jgi:hypothetical protein
LLLVARVRESDIQEDHLSCLVADRAWKRAAGTGAGPGTLVGFDFSVAAGIGAV